MNTTTTTRRGHRLAAAALAAGATIAGIAAGVSPATAATVHPDGLFAIQTCTSVTGSVQFQPGLQSKAHTQNAVLTATLDGCSFNGSAAAGQGTLTAALTGSASTAAQPLSGTYTINWPAAEHLNPSTGRISLTGPNQNVLTLSGTGTGGAFTGLPVRTALFISGHTGTGSKHNPVTSETFVNTLPLQVTENLG